MKRIALFSVIAGVAVASSGAVPNLYDTFDSLYANGFTFPAVSSTNGWQASATVASVTNGGAVSGNAGFLNGTVALTNSPAGSAGLRVWTDYQVNPVLGVEPLNLPTNTASFLCYFNSNGWLIVATASGCQVYTNDIWGNSVPPATNGYVRVSIFQDYSSAKQAVLLNAQLVAQDLPFVGGAGNYNQMVFQNTDSNSWLDNVWIKTNIGPTDLVGNRNGDGTDDAVELQLYGYASRTQYVGGAGYPNYPTIQAAVNAWRARDTLYVSAGSYTGDVTVSKAITFVGGTFTNVGTFTVQTAGVVFQRGLMCSNLVVESGATVAFNQGASLGSLSAGGSVTVGAGQPLTVTTASVSGGVQVTGAGTMTVSSSLSVTGSGLLTFTGSTLVVPANNVNMTGTFTVNNTWGTVAIMNLPFTDDFESYANNTPITSLGFRGWSASGGAVKVQSAVKHTGNNAVELPVSTVLSNSISSGAATRIWTDYYVQPTIGLLPDSPPTNTASFLAYVNTSGYLMVEVSGGGWVVCSNKIDSTSVTPISTGSFTRITVCQELVHHTFAVFVAGDLVAQGLVAPVSLSRYSGFVADNKDDASYLDDLSITTTVPAGMTSDLNHNGVPDAVEINNNELATLPLPGSVYKFR